MYLTKLLKKYERPEHKYFVAVTEKEVEKWAEQRAAREKDGEDLVRFSKEWFLNVDSLPRALVVVRKESLVSKIIKALKNVYMKIKYKNRIKRVFDVCSAVDKYERAPSIYKKHKAGEDNIEIDIVECEKELRDIK